MVKCPNCGEESSSNFCPNCGEKLEKKVICPNCAAQLDPESVFCSECGYKIKAKNEDEKASDEEEKTEETKEYDKEEITEKETSEEIKRCPHCNDILDEDDAVFCSNCGKAINADINSSNGIIESINFKKLIIVSILGFIVSFVLGIILSLIIGLTGQGTIGYPIALIIALFIGVGFFASFFEDILNSGLTGIIIGFVFGLLSNTCVEISSGLQFSYQLFSGYEIIIFTVLGLIFALLANKFLRNIVLKYIDVDKYF